MTTIPQHPVTDTADWRGSDFANSDAWIDTLTPKEVGEIEAALVGVKERGLSTLDIQAQDFPLPTLGPRLQAILDALENGRGFAVLRGLPVLDRPIEDVEALFWGLGLHLGNPVTQNSSGHLLGHVRDLGHDLGDTNTRGYQTRALLSYHIDYCDVIALLCRGKAKSGGESGLASVTAVHNEIMRRRPDLLEVLYQPFYMDRRGEQLEGQPPYFALPIFSYFEGRLTVHYIRGYIESAQRFAELPPLSDAQIEAMDLFDEIAYEDGMGLNFMCEPGDVQLINNYAVMHARLPFEDFEEPDLKRHMLRLWFCVENSRRLPLCYEERYGTTEPGTMRGGWLGENERPPSEHWALEQT